jgi:hypothetical protein
LTSGAGVLAGFRFYGGALGARPGHRNDTNVILGGRGAAGGQHAGAGHGEAKPEQPATG